MRKVDEGNVQNYWGFAGAYYFLPLASVNAQLKDFGYTSGFTNAMAVGLDRGGKVRSDEFIFPFVTYLSLHYLLPQEISTANDSLRMKLNGYNFQFDFLGLDYSNSDHATLTAGIAWAFGRLKATQTGDVGSSVFTNGYFAPQIRMEFNYRFGKYFYVGVRAAYRLDVTKPGWTETGITSPHLVNTKLDGAMMGAFIGFKGISFFSDFED